MFASNPVFSPASAGNTPVPSNTDCRPSACRVPSELFVWNQNECVRMNTSIPPPSKSATSSAEGGFKMLGMCSRQEALKKLANCTAVMYHEKTKGDNRPLRLALSVNDQKILLSIVTSRLESGVSVWGIENSRKQTDIMFRSKELLLEFYSLYPETAVVFYFND